MGRSTDRTRRRVKRQTGGREVNEGQWFDPDLALLSPTPKQRHDWERVRKMAWDKWAQMKPEDRPEGNRFAVVGALVMDWENHLGPRPLTEESLIDYRELAGPGFDECMNYLKNEFL